MDRACTLAHPLRANLGKAAHCHNDGGGGGGSCVGCGGGWGGGAGELVVARGIRVSRCTAAQPALSKAAKAVITAMLHMHASTYPRQANLGEPNFGHCHRSGSGGVGGGCGEGGAGCWCGRGVVVKGVVPVPKIGMLTLPPSE